MGFGSPKGAFPTASAGDPRAVEESPASVTTSHRVKNCSLIGSQDYMTVTITSEAVSTAADLIVYGAANVNAGSLDYLLRSLKGDIV